MYFLIIIFYNLIKYMIKIEINKLIIMNILDCILRIRWNLSKGLRD